MRSEPAGTWLVSAASFGVEEVKMNAPPSRVILLGLHNRIGALTLGVGHVRTQLRDIAIVLHALYEEPGIYREHRY
jgi:hypothetical protein